ncbi:hypothetical protein PCE1_003346 [Barthelona sp. PCE]
MGKKKMPQYDIGIIQRGSSHDFELISQGAEGCIYSGIYQGQDVIVKERFSKTYRVPELDRSILETRNIREVKNLFRASTYGVNTPSVLAVIPPTHIVMSKIDGITVKEALFNIPEQRSIILCKMADSIARLHNNELIHGDLTTLNMMWNSENEQLSVIDFGLSFMTVNHKDKAMDLYVLQRAFTSVHSADAELFQDFFNEYMRHLTQESQKLTLHYLEMVRSFGRKKE